MKKGFLIIALIHIFLVIAFMVVFDYQQISEHTDSKRYLTVADEFASLEFNFSHLENCITAPGYPLFLAFIKPFTGHNMYLIALLQSILFLASFWYFLVALQSKYNFSTLAALLVSVFVLWNPEIIHLNYLTLTESLTASLILFVCGSVINGLDKKSDNYIFVLCFSFLAITKMEYILWLLLLIPFLYHIQKRKIILVTGLSLICLFSLNGLRNKSIYGVFKPTSFGAGTVIYGGNNLNLDGSWHMYGTPNYIPKKYSSTLDSIFKLDGACACIKQDSLYKEMAIDAWKSSYIDQLKIIPVKFGKLWVLPGSMDFYTGQKEFYRGLQIEKLFSDELWPWYGKWKHGAYLLAYWVSILLFFIGFYIKIKRHKFDKIDFLLISIVLLNTFMYSIPFYGLGRFHWPVLTLLFYYALYICDYYEKKTANSQ